VICPLFWRVSVSRGAHDAQIFTSDREKLPTAFGHDVSRQSAHVPEINAEQTIAALIEGGLCRPSFSIRRGESGLTLRAAIVPQGA